MTYFVNNLCKCHWLYTFKLMSTCKQKINIKNTLTFLLFFILFIGGRFGWHWCRLRWSGTWYDWRWWNLRIPHVFLRCGWWIWRKRCRGCLHNWDIIIIAILWCTWISRLIFRLEMCRSIIAWEVWRGWSLWTTLWWSAVFSMTLTHWTLSGIGRISTIPKPVVACTSTTTGISIPTTKAWWTRWWTPTSTMEVVPLLKSTTIKSRKINSNFQ